MKTRLHAWLGLAGLLLVTALVMSQGVGDVLRSLSVVQWWILPVCAVFGLFLALGTAGWRCLFAKAHRLRFRTLFRSRWIANSINNLLPVAQVGGDVVRIRMLIRDGLSGPVAAASVVVDVTLAVGTQIIFSVIGVVLWIRAAGWDETATAALIAISLVGVGVSGFVLAQGSGVFGRAAGFIRRRVKSSQWAAVSGSAEALDHAVAETYRRRAAMGQATAWRMVSWGTSALELWVILLALGRPVSFTEAIILESLGQAVRKAAFLVPGAVGVQEGGFMLLGASMGLTPETGLTLSLVKRLRELLIGIPALIAWRFSRPAPSGTEMRTSPAPPLPDPSSPPASADRQTAGRSERPSPDRSG